MGSIDFKGGPKRASFHNDSVVQQMQSGNQGHLLLINERDSSKLTRDEDQSKLKPAKTTRTTNKTSKLYSNSKIDGSILKNEYQSQLKAEFDMIEPNSRN